MTENSDRIERTIELLLYAPLGIGLFLKDTLSSLTLGTMITATILQVLKNFKIGYKNHFLI